MSTFRFRFFHVRVITNELYDQYRCPALHCRHHHRTQSNPMSSIYGSNLHVVHNMQSVNFKRWMQCCIRTNRTGAQSSRPINRQDKRWMCVVVCHFRVCVMHSVYPSIQCIISQYGMATHITTARLQQKYKIIFCSIEKKEKNDELK